MDGVMDGLRDGVLDGILEGILGGTLDTDGLHGGAVRLGRGGVLG